MKEVKIDGEKGKILKTRKGIERTSEWRKGWRLNKEREAEEDENKVKNDTKCDYDNSGNYGNIIKT